MTVINNHHPKPTVTTLERPIGRERYTLLASVLRYMHVREHLVDDLITGYAHVHNGRAALFGHGRVGASRFCISID